MVREVVYTRKLVTFYRILVQAVLLFRLETWVVSLHIGRTLGGFHHQVICKLTGRQTRCKVGGSWFYSPLAAVLA